MYVCMYIHTHGQADVVVASLIGVAHEGLSATLREHAIRFHTVVIDEATQAGILKSPLYSGFIQRIY